MSGLRGQPVEHRQHALVLLQPVVLNFQEEILLPEQIAIFVGQPLGVVVAIGQQRFVDVAAQARRKRDQSLGMPREQVLIDARLVIEPVQIPAGNKLDEVAIAFLVFAQQHQVVIAIRFALNGLPLLRDVNLAADHRMDALGLGAVIKLDRAEQIAMVGHGHRRHLLLGGELHQLRYLASSVEQRVIGVAMKMNERRGHRYNRRGRPSL